MRSNRGWPPEERGAARFRGERVRPTRNCILFFPCGSKTIPALTFVRVGQVEIRKVFGIKSRERVTTYGTKLPRAARLERRDITRERQREIVRSETRGGTRGTCRRRWIVVAKIQDVA